MALFLTIWLSIFSHPHHVTVTNMDIDAEKGSIAMSIKIFTYDLETVLHNKYNVDGWIGMSNEHPNARQLMKEYVNERFSVSVNNGAKIELVTDSLTIVADAVFFHMKGEVNETISRVVVDNRLLIEFFSAQNNLVIINNGTRDFAYSLNRRNHNIELSL